MSGPVWSGTLEVRCPDATSAQRLYRALAPESAREVPRARAELASPADATLSLRLEAADTGALRAAVQTFLGWVELSQETVARAGER